MIQTYRYYGTFFLAFSLLLNSTLFSHSPFPKLSPLHYHQNSLSQQQGSLELLKKINFRGDEKILDIGCGPGNITAYIAKKITRGHIIGTDIAADMITFAQNCYPLSKYQNLQFKQVEASKINYDSSFDVITSFYCMHWIKDKKTVLKKISAALKPGGQFICAMNYSIPEGSGLSQACFATLKNKKWQQNPTVKNITAKVNTIPTVDAMKKHLTDANFEATLFEPTNLPAHYASLDSFAQAIQKAIPFYAHKVVEKQRSAFVKEMCRYYAEQTKQNISGKIVMKRPVLFFMVKKKAVST